MHVERTLICGTCYAQVSERARINYMRKKMALRNEMTWVFPQARLGVIMNPGLP
jgi:hypothetical protein